MFFIPYGTREKDHRQKFPYITLLLAAINIAIFGIEIYFLANFGESGLASVINNLAINPSNITDGTPIETSLITSMFLHGGLLHLVGNMIYFLPFGDNVEDRLGHFKYLLFYLLCGLVGSLAYVLFNPNSTIPLLGASGAIAGVLGGYIALHPLGTVKGFLWIIVLLVRVDLPAILFIGYWFLLQVFSSVASLGGESADIGGVAFLAHVGGFVAGLVLAPILAIINGRASSEQNTAQTVD